MKQAVRTTVSRTLGLERLLGRAAAPGSMLSPPSRSLTPHYSPSPSCHRGSTDAADKITSNFHPCVDIALRKSMDSVEVEGYPYTQRVRVVLHRMAGRSTRSIRLLQNSPCMQVHIDQFIGRGANLEAEGLKQQ